MSSARRVGRKKLFTNRLTVPISEDLLNRVDAVLLSEENRLDLIRDAVTREVIRREKKPSISLSPAKIDEIENLFDKNSGDLLKTMEELKILILDICSNKVD